MSTAVFVPSDLASKRLSVTNYGDGKRKVQISSNLLKLFGFDKGVKVVEQSLGDGRGYEVLLADSVPLAGKVKQIYSREYKKRRSNPFELLFETSSKKILDKSIPMWCKKVHVTLLHGRMIFKPLVDHVAQRIEKMLKSKDPYSVFGACTSGIDLHAAESVGFDIKSALDFRPPEARDKGKASLEETGLMSVLSNISLSQSFNEDITEVSTNYLQWAMKNNPSNLFTISLCCTEFSNLKAEKFKKQSLEDLTSTLDMAYDGLRIIEKLNPPMIFLEQVENFSKSQVGQMWELRLKKWGYKVFSMVIDPRDYGVPSSRKRFFSFATSLPSDFSFPESSTAHKGAVWDEYVVPFLSDLRDVSHCKSIQEGKKSGRLRTITEESLYLPTISKSQQKQCKDSVVVEYNGRFLFPNEDMMRKMMGIPTEFSTSVNSQTVSSEIIGQGVDYTVYQKLMLCIKKHIDDFMQQSSLKSA